MSHCVFGKLVPAPSDIAVQRITVALGQGWLRRTHRDRRPGHDEEAGAGNATVSNPRRLQPGFCEPRDRGSATDRFLVALQRGRAAGGVQIEVMDPNVILTLVDHPDLAPMAAEVRQKLEQALAQVWATWR